MGTKIWVGLRCKVKSNLYKSKEIAAFAVISFPWLDFCACIALNQ